MIDSILVSIAGAAIVFFLRMTASMCNARMDTVSHHYDNSIYKYQIRQWFDPIVSWTNKDDYPQNKEAWRMLGAKFLPKLLYAVVNKVKPAYDPFSDFWHYQKFLWFMLDLAGAIVWSLTIYISTRLHISIAAFVICMAMCAWSWSYGWLLTFNANLKKLEA